ncbi:MAG: methyltransferase domain-containing protein [Verrucomicrobiota bacterium]
MKNVAIEKFTRLLACPSCKSAALVFAGQQVKCDQCDDCYDVSEGTPVLIQQDSPILEWFQPQETPPESSQTGLKHQLEEFYRWAMPEDRVWSVQSKAAIERVVEENNPDQNDKRVVLIGAGFESVYQKILAPYRQIFRIGLAMRGAVDAYADICDMPFVDNEIDLLLSSSVLEHVYDPEKAIAEMFRVTKPGGYVYAEIPFMRAYHMMPIDYQRYTISGIEELFKRHGFKLEDKGVCSGPFNAAVLFFLDMLQGLLSGNKYVMALVMLPASLLLHLFKYLDRLVEGGSWAEINACNFYYVGKKPLS